MTEVLDVGLREVSVLVVPARSPRVSKVALGICSISVSAVASLAATWSSGGLRPVPQAWLERDVPRCGSRQKGRS